MTRDHETGLTLDYETETTGHEGPHHYEMKQWVIATLYSITAANGRKFEDAREWDSLVYNEDSLYFDMPTWSALEEELRREAQ